MENIDKYKDMLIEMVVEWGPKVLTALVVLIIGSWIIKMIKKVASKLMQKSKVEESLQKFLGNLIGWALKVVLIIVVLSQVGIETTSFIAVIGGASLAIGLALQGSLANFAGGALIMIFKPFKVGDLIEAQGVFGQVQEIQIFVTKIATPENKTAIVPNGTLSNGNVVNYSVIGNLRVDLIVGISYNADIETAKKALLKVMQDDDKVLNDPAPSVSVSELGDSSVNLAVRPYATPADYWDVYFGTLEKCKIALDKAGIEIPFPQRVIHNA